MSTETYTSRARAHWTKWRPKEVARLREAGELESALQAAGKAAQARVTALMQAGFQQHEAEEVALHECVLLKPEPGAVGTRSQRREAAKMEREYQAQMRDDGAGDGSA